MSGPFGSSQWMYASGEAESQSLRFNDDDSAYLSRTPASAGNRKTWTFSVWVKRGNLSSSSVFNLIMARTGAGTPYTYVDISTDQIRIGDSISGGLLETNAVFRDASAWYHIVASVDTTNATAADRFKIYVNGVRETSFSTNTSPTLNSDTAMNSTVDHQLGMNASIQYFDGYMSEINLVDGTALDPTSFGETDANGQWVPIIEPDVTYGTNGFYLPFTNDYEVEGFNTVTYRGNGGTQYIGGVGFEPDFVWVKSRSNTYSHNLHDVIRGTSSYLVSNSTAAENTSYTDICVFNADGFTLSSASSANVSSTTNVAWCWDMGTGSPVSNTDGSITSTVKANPTYGQSIVTWTGTGTTVQETIGVGLDWSGKDKLVITKNRDSSTYNWGVNSSVLAVNKVLSLNTINNDSQENSSHYITYETNGFRTYNGGAGILNQSGQEYIAYCFHSVAGYSDFGSYTGNGSTTGPTITTGFKPAFLVLKRTDGANSWTIQDNTRDPSNPIDLYLLADDSQAEGTSGLSVDFLSNGFQIKTTSAAINASGGSYIYIAFADKREAAFWLDQSGNNNDWTNNNMQESDCSIDSPLNNFATLNVLNKWTNITLTEGNLTAKGYDNAWRNVDNTIHMSSGKWYWEVYINNVSTYQMHGIVPTVRSNGRTDFNGDIYPGSYSDEWGYRNNGYLYNSASPNTSWGSTYTTGDVLGFALDMDAGTLDVTKNGASTGSQITGISGTYRTCCTVYGSSSKASYNFGQDSSFAGNKVAQGNQDANGKGDFYYEPPAGYLALCTDNLPDPAIADGSEHFNTLLWTGDNTSPRTISNTFDSDFVWVKARSVSRNHVLFDTLRTFAADKELISNGTSSEGANQTSLYGYVSDTTSTGIELTGGTSGKEYVNENGTTYVAWNWKANGSGASNTDGTITSTVSANTTAGFSVVSYTGTGASATVGHGLSSAPSLIIVKNRDAGKAWTVYSDQLSTPDDQYLYLNSTAGEATYNFWNSTSPTSSVFSISGDTNVNASSQDIIAYCFHSVEGYSKFGSYTGNSSTDGPFVYTGFKPAFVMVKATGTASNWFTWDVQRNTYNAATTPLFPNSIGAEEATLYPIDFLSNGFKLRASAGYGTNESAAYIYMAFAESPFKYSNAR